MVNEILGEMAAAIHAFYADSGRPSDASEYLLRASILQIIYSVRSERALIEESKFIILFRWFIQPVFDAREWDRSTFSMNCDRLLVSDIVKLFFA